MASVSASSSQGILMVHLTFLTLAEICNASVASSDTLVLWVKLWKCNTGPPPCVFFKGSCLLSLNCNISFHLLNSWESEMFVRHKHLHCLKHLSFSLASSLGLASDNRQTPWSCASVPWSWPWKTLCTSRYDATITATSRQLVTMCVLKQNSQWKLILISSWISLITTVPNLLSTDELCNFACEKWPVKQKQPVVLSLQFWKSQTVCSSFAILTVSCNTHLWFYCKQKHENHKTKNSNSRIKTAMTAFCEQQLQPFYGSLDFVRDNPGEPVPEETFTHSHLSSSSITPYLLPPSIMIHGILRVRFTCLTVFSHNYSPRFLWYTSWSGTLNYILHTFLHTIIVFFS